VKTAATKSTPASDKAGSPRALSSSEQITRSLVDQVGVVASSCGASAVFVAVDALAGTMIRLPEELEQTVYYLTKSPDESAALEADNRRVIRVPNVSLTRMGQVKIAVLLALSRGLLRRGDTIVCLSGVVGSGALDTFVVVEVGREFEMFTAPNSGLSVGQHVLPEVLERVVDIAAELGSEGREGKPVGALFVIGDTGRVLSLSRQLILNPFQGYPEERRNVLDPALEETVKEFAGIDGAFVVRGDGVIESAGAFLRMASSDEESKLPQGLGARHHAAAGITAVSGAVAITVSESTGTVTIFQNGRIITDIEKPRASSGKRLS
jgi:diadenylate cyclase